jgi:hypothetical protein
MRPFTRIVIETIVLLVVVIIVLVLIAYLTGAFVG